MCGIAAILRRNLAPLTARQWLDERLLPALHHRGPDDRGAWENGPAHLGHCRLSVIDLDGGHQPIFNETGEIGVVVNGEIYNFQELRAELLARGHHFRTRADTEVVVHAYEEYGDDFVTHLAGMFAFVLWDARRRRMLAARDRLGKKPFYYWDSPRAFVMASELAALLRLDDLPRTLDREALDLYLATLCVPAPWSIFRAVRKLPPAHLLIADETGLRIRRYWMLDFNRKLPPHTAVPEAREQLLSTLRKAVQRRLVSDVPLGAFLSGGVDSSVIVGLMAEASTRPVRTFAVGFDSEIDERPYARMVARRFGTEHTEVEVGVSLDAIPRAVLQFGEPFGDSSCVPCLLLSELTRRHVTVVLNGDGGDECFGGYGHYETLARLLEHRRRPARRRLARQLLSVGARVRPAWAASLGSLDYLDAVTRQSPDPHRQFYQLMDSMYFSTPARRDLYRDGMAGMESTFAAFLEGFAAQYFDEPLDRAFHFDLLSYMPGDLLPKADITTMAFGLEGRSPFLDHEVVELTARWPPHWKVVPGERKRFLRQALRGWLPDEILDRRKQGFGAPVKAWMRHPMIISRWRDLLSGWSGAALLDAAKMDLMYDRFLAGRDGDEFRLWQLFVLLLWWERYRPTL